MKPSWRPLCPNHNEILEGIPFPIPSKGIGICPVSGCPFEYEADIQDQEETTALDKNGNKIKKVDWKLTGND